MFDALETGIGLDVILWLQDLRFGGLEGILRFLSLAGGELFYILILGLIYWAFNKQLGLRMFFALITISLLTSACKDLFARPRPYQISDAVIPLFTEESFGIPSGHTSITLVFWGYLAVWFQKRSVTAAVIFYVAIQGLGRMLAGVHFPQDVLGGIVLGLLVLALFIRIEKPVSAFWNQRTMIQQAMLIGLLSGSLIVLVFLAFDDLARMESYLTMAGLLAGGGLAAGIEPRFIRFLPHTGRVRVITQYILGIALCIGLLIGLKAAFAALDEVGRLAAVLRVVRYGLVAFTALGLWPLLSIRSGLSQESA